MHCNIQKRIMQLENMDSYNLSFDWDFDVVLLEKSWDGKRYLGNFEKKSLVFPNKPEAEENAGFWYLNLIVSRANVTFKLCLARGEVSNYYFSEFEVSLLSIDGYKWIHRKNKILFHIKHNQEYSDKTFLTQKLLGYLAIKDNSAVPLKIFCKMGIKVEKCIINAVPKEIPHFEKLFDNHEFSNFIIIASGKEFNVHTNILAARSDVFSAMFENKMRVGEKQCILRINDFNAEVVQEFLNYIYCGRVQYLDRLSEELLRAADVYSIDGLKSICLEEITKKISLENALDLLSLVDYHKVDYLKANILNFIVMNIKKFDQSQFKSLKNVNVLNEILLKVIQLMD